LGYVLFICSGFLPPVHDPLFQSGSFNLLATEVLILTAFNLAITIGYRKQSIVGAKEYGKTPLPTGANVNGIAGANIDNRFSVGVHSLTIALSCFSPFLAIENH